MIKIYLLSVDQWLGSLPLASAVLNAADREVCFVDPQQFDQEIEQLSLLANRLPVEFIDATGSNQIATALSAAGFKSHVGQPAGDYDWVQLVESFGTPKGFCAASAGSASDCLKAAVIAVRLGYYFLPLQPAGGHADAIPSGVSLVWYGNKTGLHDAVGAEASTDFLTISNDSEATAFLAAEGCLIDYLVILNSADLFRDMERGDCLGKLWVRGLSLLAVILASYRRIYIFDAAAANPDSRDIEIQVTKMVQKTGIKPRFQAVLASPAVVPFIYEEKKALGAVTEEMVRDIHVRLNNDLFFDLAEGRLMQHNPGGLSMQLISTKRYSEIQERSAQKGNDVLIVSTPYVDTGIIFSTDEALIDSQLLPLLEDAGYNINLLQYREAHYRKVSEALARSDYFLFTGHGGPEGLHTHGRTLNRADLPTMPPLVAYASACSTVALVPHWYSTNEGIEWQGVPVDSRQVIGLSFVEKGAICFVGGATIEDLQYTTSTYSVFMEALLLKGLSVGEAVQEIRHVISLYSATLLQKNPEAYRKYRWGTANAIHQQVLLGDPAFTPAADKYSAAALPQSLEGSETLKRITVEIPEARWQRSQASINKKDPSRHYYRCRNVEVITPYGEDVFSWGDYYRIAPDAKNISESAVKSSFLHMSLDLPSGFVPKSLKLVEAELGESECLLCGEAVEHDLTPLEAMQKFKLPYLLQPPIELNMENGWAFCTELHEDYIRLRWLVPLLLIDEKSRSAYPLKKFTFQVESVPAQIFEGRVINQTANHTFVVFAGYPQSDQEEINLKGLMKTTVAAALSGSDGIFEITCPQDAALVLHEQFPLYDLLEDYDAFRKEVYPLKADHTISVELFPAEKIKLKGYFFDAGTGKVLQGVIIRIFRGEQDPVGDPLIEAYAGETVSGNKGEFLFELPAGKYILYAAAEIDGKKYKSGEWALKLREGEELNRIFSLDQAVIVSGKVSYQGFQPADPPAIALKRYPKAEGEGALVKVPVNRDGRYVCLVSFQDRFSIILEEEGWQAINDTNSDQGYKLSPQEVLERNYLLIPEMDDQEGTP